MTSVRRLAPGVPDGATPQRQSGPSREYVIVSEWARKAAHELDLKRSEWLKAINAGGFSRDEFVYARGEINHVGWLTDYNSVNQKYVEVNERRQYLQNLSGEMRRTKKIDGRAYGLREFEARRAMIRAEYAYVLLLQTRLRFAANAVYVFRRDKLKEEARKQFNKISAGGGADPVLATLGVLRSGIRKLVFDGILTWEDIPPEMKAALDAAGALIEVGATMETKTEPQLAKSDYVLIDGVLARRHEANGGWG